jgi:DNA recombination protein RmuC
MASILIFVIGAIFGAALVFIILSVARKKSEDELQRTKDEMANVFKALSFEVASQSTDQLLKLAKEVLGSQTSESAADLEGKKKLIDQSLGSLAKDMQERMEKVQKLMLDINQSVPEKYGQVSAAIEGIAKQSENLRQTTESLKIAFSGSQQRGQWGERIADDILRVVGLVEGKSYIKQQQMETGRSRPDFTFLLPNDLKVNMDVKFPLNKYLEYLKADGDNQRAVAQKSFMTAVRNRIKEVTTRDYINPEENTVDYVLVFIPNEQVYAFIQESDATILDEALKQKVVLCSPLTLYAMLALIRAALDNFNLRKSSTEIQALLGGFAKQWKAFVGSMANMGKKLDSAKDEYDNLVGTRQKMLDVQVRKIDQLSKAGGIEPKLVGEGEEPPEIEDEKKSDSLGLSA